MKKVALASLVMLLSLCTYAEGSRNLAPRSSTGTGITNDENAFLFVPSSVYANNTETGLSKLSSLPATSGTQPNIVVILVDDAGYDDFGFQGSTIAISPNIDLLASEGMVFSQGYVSAGLCAPSRAGIMTGQNQNKLGFTYNIASNVDASSAAPGHTLADIGLDPNVPTMGDFMQELGYETALFGKWHLGFGAQTQHHPNNRGFDFFYGLLGGSRPYDQTTTDTDKQLQRDGVLEEPTNNNFFVTDLLTDEALVFMSTQIGANKPFLAFMSYTAPHGPYTAKPADKALFDPVSGIDDVDRNYYGLLKNVDDNIKRIVDHLKNLNEYDNTLFVFLSDNGGVVQDAGSNGLLRSGKGSSYEGGIRVPFFMTWKNMVPVGGTYNHQVISTDLLPTFIKAAGGDLTDNEYFDLEGKDLVAAAISGTAIHSRLYWRKGVGGGVVSDGTNKVRFTQGSMFSTNTPPELYNLDSDIGESTNLYASNTALAQNLLTDFGTWSQSIETPSWIPSGVVSNECGGSTNISTCSFLTNYYSTFAANSALTQEANTPLSMNQTTETITQSNLEFTDPVKSEGSISYELTQLPQSGTINRSGQPLSLGDSFTQRDINTGEITYTSSNNPANPDNMVFSVNDGAGGEELTNVTFAFTLPANYNASLDSDGDGIIDADDLDDDNDGILDVDEYNFTNNINVHPFSLGLTIPANFGDPGIDNQGGTYDMSARLGLPAGTAFITITNSATVEATQGSNGIFNLDPAETSQITISSSYPLQLRPRMGPSFNNQNDDRGIISNDGKTYSFDGTISDPAIYSHTNVGSTYTLAAIGVPPAPPNNLSVNEENAFWVCSEVSTSFDLTYFANGSGSNYNIVIRVPVDTDGDGNPDYLDLDSDGDGIPDIVEAGGTDGNNDGEVDYPTLGDPTSMVDGNMNGWSSVFDDGSTGQATESGTPLADADTDGDGFNNRLDIDSDADGIVDNIEGQTSAGYVAPTGTDTDNDGIDNAYDPDNGGTGVTPTNTDGAGNPDYLSLDSDGDGRSDHVEGYDTDNPTDGSANTFAAGTDTDGDGLDDNFDLFDATSPPVTGSNSANGVQTAASFPDTDDPGDEPNWREFNFDLVNDLDGDGITDANDLDDDNDGILDEDEYNFTQFNINAPELFPGASPGDEPADGTVDVSAILGLPSGTVEIEHIDAYVNASNANQLNVRTGANPRYIIRSTYPLQLRPRMGRSNFQTLTTDPERGFTSNDGKTFQFTNSGALNSGFSPVNSSNNYVIKRDDGITTGGTAASSGNLFWESDDFATSFDISFLEQGGGTNVLLAFNVPVDTDGDGIPDFQDADSDNDGIPDIVEAGGVDANGDGQVDYPTPGDASSMVDANGNGWSSVFDDGSADASATESGTPLTDTDTDTDLVPNRLDVDSDNDGIADVIEGQGTAAYKAPTGNDADSDGVDDAFDSDFDGGNKLSSSPINTDENNIAAFNPDAIPDYLDNDSDGDGVTDQVESGVTADASGTDTDGDGLLDDYDNYNASSPPGAPSGVNADNNGQTATNPFP
ncbi:MAG: sulfatase-like hydrolase/transferase, partial [Schleiferiaceae bacterium]|nr:sulfatase-like hydrolase/transferase [Schleiferiaceae bacterium]